MHTLRVIVYILLFLPLFVICDCPTNSFEYQQVYELDYNFISVFPNNDNGTSPDQICIAESTGCDQCR